MYDFLLWVYLSFIIFMMIRNSWVYRQRRRLMDRIHSEAHQQLQLANLCKGTGASDQFYRHLDKSAEILDEYDRYAGYGAMLAKFWIWDIEKFKQ